MADLTITASISDDDRESIVRAVIDGIKPLLSDSLERPKSREEMAQWLGVGTATLDRMTRDGMIPSLMLNRRRVYVPARVLAALEQPSPTGDRREALLRELATVCNPSELPIVTEFLEGKFDA